MLFRRPEERTFGLCPANINLAGAEVELVDVVSRETKLKEALASMDNPDWFDYILIDCPPSLGLVTINALTAASGVLVPIQSEYYALEGLTQLIEDHQSRKKTSKSRAGDLWCGDDHV